MVTSTYFKEAEFKKCSPPCSMQNMSQELLTKLDRVRVAFGGPLRLNSAYRSKEWELAKKRSGTGAHTLGVAVDIACLNEKDRFKLVSCLLKEGFTRIGIAKTYVHADLSDKHTLRVIWLY